MPLPSMAECAAALDHLAPALLIVAAGSVVVLGSAGAAALVLRRASAAARHRAWLLGFAGVLLLPVLSAVLPGWHVLPRLGAARHVPRPSAVATAEFVVVPPAVLSGAAPLSATEGSTRGAEVPSNTSTNGDSSNAEP